MQNFSWYVIFFRKGEKPQPLNRLMHTAFIAKLKNLRVYISAQSSNEKGNSNLEKKNRTAIALQKVFLSFCNSSRQSSGTPGVDIQSDRLQPGASRVDTRMLRLWDQKSPLVDPVGSDTYNL